MCEAFVRFFIDAVTAAEAVPDLLADINGEPSIRETSFGDDAEVRGEPMSVEDLRAISEDAREMRALAAELGRTLFGDAFKPSDFWQSHE